MSLKLVNFRLDEKEYDTFCDVAKSKNKSTVSIVRDLIERYNNQQKESKAYRDSIKNKKVK